MAGRERLDVAIVRRRLLETRREAQEAIEQGLVTVGGRLGGKASTLVAVAEPIAISGSPRRFVSRGGEKLHAALGVSGVDPTGLRCLDAGASTGGFTDCLLQGGAQIVVAVDVGYGQLDWRLRNDPRVVVHERTNVRTLLPTDIDGPVELCVADLSFISLRTVLSALADLIQPGGVFVFLVKPQFEVGAGRVGKGGVVREPELWRSSVELVVSDASALGCMTVGIIASPVLGPAGNVEFLIWGTRGVPPLATAAEDRKDGVMLPGLAVAIDEAIDAGRALRGAA